MGNKCCSNEINSDFNANTDRSILDKGDVNSDIVVSAPLHDEQDVDFLRRDFKDYPDIFVLNNLLMTVQFFENYVKDIQKVSQPSNNTIEKNLNKSLLKNETMECICPDTLFEVVNRNIRYRPIHGPQKNISEPLIPRRLYVVTDRIEVINSMDNPQYTSIDHPPYQVRLEQSARKGFVRLKQIDESKIPKIYSQLISEEIYPTTSSDADSTDYTTITDLRTPKPLEIGANPESQDTLPATCFSARKVIKDYYDIEDLINKHEDGMELTDDDIFEKVKYVDAKGFMNYFKNELFPNSLGKSLGFDRFDIDLGKSIPGTIFCNLTDEDSQPVPCEVIPSVAIDWPDVQTYEFIMREDRPTITDTSTGMRYKWPTDEMIKEIRLMNCVAVPKGYWRKKGTYADATLEWEIAFPKAERYIDARMSHAQMRCFLFLIILHKHYIEPFTQNQGLLLQHIRCHMYWECEKNYKDWPEHRLGVKIKKVIENLNQCLASSHLPDFFIKQKNHFRNIPKKYLEFAHKVFHNILQSPTVYFIKALRCIRYSSGKFYEPFQYKEFYNMLIETQSYKLLNPHLADRYINRRVVYEDPETQLKHLLEEKRRRKFLERKNKQNQPQADEEDNVSVDSIDLERTFEKQFDVFKANPILIQLITSFINIGKHSFKVGRTLQQHLFYFKQAYYLTRILESLSPVLQIEARELKSRIFAEEESCKISMVKMKSNIPPSTPVRNSIQFDFQTAQQLKTNTVNYNNNGVITSPSFKLRSTPVKRVKSEGNASGPRKSVARKSVAFVDP